MQNLSFWMLAWQVIEDSCVKTQPFCVFQLFFHPCFLQTADQLLARADAAKALAEESAKKGKSTFQEAQDILNNLRGHNFLIF